LSIFRSANFQGQNLIQRRFAVNSPKGEGRNQNLFFLGNIAALGRADRNGDEADLKSHAGYFFNSLLGGTNLGQEAIEGIAQHAG